MEIKGTAVKSITDFVKANYASDFVNWLKEMPMASQKIMADVRSNNWYDVEEAAIVPTKMVAKLFFDGDVKKAAWKLGGYSAETALKGIYKIYVKFSSPSHIISRGSRIIEAFYRPSKLEVMDKTANSIRIVFLDFDTKSDVIENRVGGWCEKALEISGCKDVDIKITSSISKGDANTTILCKWS